MSVTIHLPNELEEQLREEARIAGLDAADFAAQAVQEKLLSRTSDEYHQLPDGSLIQMINEGLSASDWTEYRHLVHCRREGALSDEQRSRLIALSDRLEALNARRMALLVELGRRRGKTLPEMMGALGISPPPYE